MKWACFESFSKKKKKCIEFYEWKMSFVLGLMKKENLEFFGKKRAMLSEWMRANLFVMNLYCNFIEFKQK
jgi:hypothetical protein